jgi:hypothetical protein
MKSRCLFILFLLISFSGCFLAEEVTNVMKSWDGAYVGDLIRSWGPPQQAFADGYGGQVFVYTDTRITGYRPATSTTTASANANIRGNYIYGQGTSQTVYNPALLYGYTAYRMFYVNKEGRIYSWSWRGLAP